MKHIAQMQKTARELPADLMDAGHNVWLAGMGAVGIIGNTTTTLFDTLVEEGKRFQKSEIKLVNKVVSQTTDTVTGVIGEAVDYVETNVQHATKAALNRLGMPSRRDVAELSARVETLTHKVETLGRKGTAHA